MTDTTLTERQREILEFIESTLQRPRLPAVGPRDRRGGRAHVVLHRARPPGHPPAPGLPPPRPHQAPRHRGPLRRRLGRRRSRRRPVRHVPLVGDVAAGTDVLAQENVEELLPLPADFTGDGQLFMLRVRGDSMIDAGILDGDYVVVRQQAEAAQGRHRRGRHPRRRGHGEDLHPQGRQGRAAAPPTRASQPMEFDPADVTIYGKVVTVLRRL